MYQLGFMKNLLTDIICPVLLTCSHSKLFNANYIKFLKAVLLSFQSGYKIDKFSYIVLMSFSIQIIIGVTAKMPPATSVTYSTLR